MRLTQAVANAQRAAGRRSLRAGTIAQDAPPAIAGLALVAVFVAWGQNGAGYKPTLWLPGALLAVGLAAIVIVVPNRLSSVGRLAAVALATLGAFTAWSFASIAWAGVRDDAWTGSNRTLLYFATFALFCLLPWTPGAARVVAWSYAAGVTVVAAAAIVRAATSTDPDLFIRGRFTYPTEYTNANVAFFLSGFWIALGAATRREQSVVVRALALGAVAFLPQAALLSQSRTSLVAVPLTGVVLLALAPGRLRTAAGLAVGVIPVVLAWDVHGEVYRTAEQSSRFLEDTMQPSALWMATTGALAAAIGLVWALLDRRVSPSPAVMRVANGIAALFVAVGIAICAVAVARADPVNRVRDGWSEFTNVEGRSNRSRDEDENRSRFSSVQGQRWDFWRVAMNRWQDEPILGIGAENFAVDYLRDGRAQREPKYAHSLEVGLLSQLGIVGAVLFALFAVATTALTVPRRSDQPALQAVRIGAFGLWIYWLVHASDEWFYELPAVTAPAFAFAGLAIAVGRLGGTRMPRRAPLPLSLSIGVAALAAAAFLSIAPPFLAAKNIEVAIDDWARDPEASYQRLERARSLNPLSGEPDLVAGVIAARYDDRPRMRRHFAASVERDPLNWYARLELALTHSLDGERDAALRELRRALELNPQETVLQEVLPRIRRGEQIAPRSLDQVFTERVQDRVS